MNYNELAFFTGLFGSIHCVGMCGPLAFAVPSFHKNRWLIILDKLVYNLGRTLTYTLLGIIIGLIGRQLWLAGIQSSLSILTGVFIILAASSRILKISFGNGKWVSKMVQPFNKLLSYAMRHKAGHLITGILNGFLPCGFVYLAMAGALNTGSVMSSAQYMFFFGLGTLPLMLAAMVSTGLAGLAFRRRINKAIPFAMLGLGVWFILRGLNLDIPYLSPEKVNEGVEVCFRIKSGMTEIC
ncbi:sulfite exporter TauE/SafE family protein [Daejeonella sp.]|uniref:sulfite exporter TauE/SafE family protein n=1 Tax=Daejeonella sp. TaxID=2805397 RepID=UPI0027BA24C0|nr:sulfite exporter TauE/SafE family protein [Daejeonella sp.]